MIGLKKEKVREALSYFNLDSIPNREKYVLTHYYGLDGNQFKSLEKVAEDLGLSKTRIDEIKNEWMRYIVGSKVEDLATDKKLSLSTPVRSRIEIGFFSLDKSYEEIIDVGFNGVSYEYIKQLGNKKGEEYKSIKYKYSNNSAKYRKQCKIVLDEIDNKIRKDCSIDKTKSSSYIRIYTEYMASFIGKLYRAYEINTIDSFYDILNKLKELIGDKFPIPKIVEEVLNT